MVVRRGVPYASTFVSNLYIGTACRTTPHTFDCVYLVLPIAIPHPSRRGTLYHTLEEKLACTTLSKLAVWARGLSEPGQFLTHTLKVVYTVLFPLSGRFPAQTMRRSD